MIGGLDDYIITVTWSTLSHEKAEEAVCVFFMSSDTYMMVRKENSVIAFFIGIKSYRTVLCCLSLAHWQPVQPRLDPTNHSHRSTIAHDRTTGQRRRLNARELNRG